MLSFEFELSIIVQTGLECPALFTRGWFMCFDSGSPDPLKTAASV